jgi:hypothetical protein
MASSSVANVLRALNSLSVLLSGITLQERLDEARPENELRRSLKADASVLNPSPIKIRYIKLPVSAEHSPFREFLLNGPVNSVHMSLHKRPEGRFG